MLLKTIKDPSNDVTEWSQNVLIIIQTIIYISNMLVMKSIDFWLSYESSHMIV